MVSAIKVAIVVEGGPTPPKQKAGRDAELQAMNIEIQGLRQAWGKLLGVAVEPTGSYPNAVASYKARIKNKENVLLLVDSDGADRKTWLKQQRLEDAGENVFFMVQTVEAWFLSQPQIIEAQYGTYKENATKIAVLLEKYPNYEAIEKPKDVLTTLLYECFIAAKYRPKQEAALVERLDIDLLKNTFSEARNLFERIYLKE